MLKGNSCKVAHIVLSNSGRQGPALGPGDHNLPYIATWMPSQGAHSGIRAARLEGAKSSTIKHAGYAGSPSVRTMHFFTVTLRTRGRQAPG